MVHRIATSKKACCFLNIVSEKYVVLKNRGPADCISVISKYLIPWVTVYVLVCKLAPIRRGQGGTKEREAATRLGGGIFK